ncbi:hypothetical protein [Mucilaginibacter paludis]|uniref:DAC domain-containing protein n=1 Tax=Mucilaginibacter paludis DSM 18603 TaxID=714943 RepID=H1XZ59_9SPHI|nr:hypothetical protein [Mucilaginibacter paludis]EHQ24644.1 hypothetical protein Mucpa_0450 [Mucilaginibacter paludis DSM 18603]
MSNYPESLIYFMWPWQVYYRISAQTSAETLFNKLDTGLQPNVFLIGFLKKDRQDRLPICVEPEDIDFKLSEFNALTERAREHFNKHERREMFYSGPGQQEEMHGRLINETLQSALVEILNQSENNNGKISFASKAVMIDDFEVYVILQLDREIYKTHDHLSIERNDQNLKIHTSLLSTVVEVYLEERTRTLYYPNPGKNLSGDSRIADELWREAARTFMYTISSKGKDFYGLHGLFDACNKLSIARYEGEENQGYLIISDKMNVHVELLTTLEAPFNFKEFRRVRKLLQLSNDEIGMVCNTNNVFGLGRISNEYDPALESVFVVRFISIHCWDVLHHGKPILQMRYSLPEFPPETISKSKFFSDAERTFSLATKDDLEHLYDLALTVTNQAKGALLIISNDAQNEAKRLGNQCFPLIPEKLSADTILNLTTIDGGVLIDQHGLVFAYGVILDGVVGKEGDSARGSRYNSAITYHEYKRQISEVMVVIVSEDGSVDVIPNLRPQIKHSEIERIISLFESMVNTTEKNVGNFNQIMEWFQNRRFYLTAEECERINKARIKIEENFGIQNVRIVYDDLMPNSEMNTTYYINEHN